MSIEGQVAVVTGAARGVGRAICRQLSSDGARIAAVDLLDATETVAELPNEAMAFRCDVTSPDEVAALVGAVTDALGPCRILVNNVGIYPPTPFFELPFEEWRRVLSVNVDSAFLMSQAFGPAMLDGGAGRIVNIGSAITHAKARDLLAYIASKGAVHALTRALANELSPGGVTVNAVAPSIMATEGVFLRERAIEGLSHEEELALVAGHQTIRRPQTPEDVAATVGFLASESASFITGQILHVDGGSVRSGA